MKKVLILGAGGFIGRSLCEKILQTDSVIAYDLKLPDTFINRSDVQCIENDFSKENNFRCLLEETDLVYHLISTTLPSENTSEIPEEIINNVVPTVRLLEAIKNSKHKIKIVFASSGGTIYGETGDKKNKVTDPLHPICSYGVQKKTIEAYMEFYGASQAIDYRIARISNPYGVGQDKSRMQGVIPILINRLILGESATIFGDGNSKRDYLYMDDLIEALLKLGQYDGSKRVFNIASGNVYTLHEVIKIIQKELGRSFTYINYVPARNFDVSNTILDIEDTINTLHWVPHYNINDGIKAIISKLI